MASVAVPEMQSPPPFPHSPVKSTPIRVAVPEMESPRPNCEPFFAVWRWILMFKVFKVFTVFKASKETYNFYGVVLVDIAAIKIRHAIPY